MEIGKVQNSIVSKQAVSSQKQTTQTTQPSPVFEYNPYMFTSLDFNIPRSEKAKTATTPKTQDTEMAASEVYEKHLQEKGRAPYFCEQKILDDIEEAGVTTSDIIKQHNAESAINLAAKELGVKIDEKIIKNNKELRALIVKYETGKINEKEYCDAVSKLEINGIKKDTRTIIPPKSKNVSHKQGQELKGSIQARSEYATIGIEVARKLSTDDKQKKKLETTYTESVPKKREEVLKAIEEVLPEDLDEESIKNVVEATEPVDTVERTYAAEIIKEADYLTEEEKEQKLEVIGKNKEEIQKIARENTLKFTEQIIEYRKEQAFIRKQENHKTQITKQENLKREYKIKEFKKEKLDNKESKFKNIINKLLERIKKSQKENNNDKYSQSELAQAKDMKRKLENKLYDIQSQKRIVEFEMSRNEISNTMILQDLQDEIIKSNSDSIGNF